MRRILAYCIIALYVTCPVQGETFKYSSDGRRDPFVPLIGQVKAPVNKLEDITSPEDLKLEGIVINAKGERIVILNGEMMRARDKLGAVEIKKITANSVTLLLSGAELTLKLSEEGGNKRE